jgi:hypothetical protein
MKGMKLLRQILPCMALAIMGCPMAIPPASQSYSTSMTLDAAAVKQTRRIRVRVPKSESTTVDLSFSVRRAQADVTEVPDATRDCFEIAPSRGAASTLTCYPKTARAPDVFMRGPSEAGAASPTGYVASIDIPRGRFLEDPGWDGVAQSNACVRLEGDTLRADRLGACASTNVTVTCEDGTTCERVFEFTVYQAAGAVGARTFKFDIEVVAQGVEESTTIFLEELS